MTQYNSEANSQDLVSSITFHTDASTTDYSVNDRTRNVNKWYHKAVVLIQSADGTWQYDDANNTTLPIGTADLVSGQQDYSLDDSMLEIERVEIKDSGGNWVKLRPFDQVEVGVAMDEFMETDAQPMYYDKIGRSLFLYPAPNYASTGGLKVHFKRHANIFVVGDTTKEPGFADAFHEYVALGASLDYCKIYKPERVQAILNDITDMERDIKEFYGRRNKDVRRALRSNPPMAV